ncbi:hypothetical protein PU560_07410, partial [Georgenia sp. 10Sc9-8]|nr:hypothetical protein [Georgenia halotolerans]
MTRRTWRRSTAQDAGVASVATVALAATMMMGAGPAAAMPLSEVPDDPADWATTPYSPLAPDAVAAQDPLELEFDGTDGGLLAGNDVDTGFTMVQPSSEGGEYYVPELMEVADGQLTITPTQGIAYLQPGETGGSPNAQDNTLGVGVDATDTNLRFTTSLNSPADATGYAQAGLWFGPDEDNYVKLALIGSGDIGRQIQLSREVDGVTDTSASGGDQATITTDQASVEDGPVTLTLDVNTITGTITGYYQLTGGEQELLGTVDLPESFVDGTLLATDVGEANTFAGIFATRRNLVETAPLAYSFEDFSVTELDAEPPAAPSGATATGTPSAVTVEWDQAADDDVVGYRVYRGDTSPVATVGTGLGGTEPLTDPSFVDENVFIGEDYTYAVVAVDETGNVSEGAEAQATVPGVDGEEIDRVNFETDTTATPEGYIADIGLAYDDARGFGWISAADGTPLDQTERARERSGGQVNPDLRLATITHMQHTSAEEDGVWEYDLADGTYTVVVAVGDAGPYANAGYDSVNVIEAEGERIVDGFVPTASREYDEAVGTVEVTDGALTIAPADGANTKLAYVEIYADDVAEEPVAPVAPAGLSTEVTDGGVVLSWNSAAEATGYDVFRSTEQTVPTDGTPLTSVTDTMFVDATAEAGQTYYYVVVATNEAGASEPTTAVEASVPADEPAELSAPADLAGTSGETGVELSWTEVEGATGYDVFRSTTETVATENPLTAEPIDASTYLDETAEAGQTYYYVVVALGEGNTSPPSAAVDVTVPEAAPELVAPADVTGALVNGAVELSWTAVEDVDGYNVFRGVDGPAEATGEPLNDELVTGTTYTDADVAPGVSYSYVVVAVTGDDVSEASGQATVPVPAEEPEPGLCADGEWSAKYFQNVNLTGDVFGEDCLDDVSMNWGSGGPDGLDKTNRFS